MDFALRVLSYDLKEPDDPPVRKHNAGDSLKVWDEDVSGPG